MKTVASSDQELTVEERNLLSVAYKNVIGARRASWRIVSSIEQKEESKGNDQQVTMIKSYREKIEAELAKICEDILEVLDKHLIPSAASGESKVFYHKMYAIASFGLWRWLADASIQDGRLPPIPRRVCHWRQAKGLGRQVARGLQGCFRRCRYRAPAHASHPTRSRPQLLRLLVSPLRACAHGPRKQELTIFPSYEILNSPDRACHLAKQAFDDAIAELDTLSEESYK